MEIVAEASRESPIVSWFNEPGSGGRCSTVSLGAFNNFADPSSLLGQYAPLVHCLRKQLRVKASLYVLSGCTAFTSNSSGSNMHPVVNCAAQIDSASSADSPDDQSFRKNQTAWLYGTCDPLLTWRESNVEAFRAYAALTIPLFDPTRRPRLAKPASITYPVDESAVLLKSNIEDIERLLGLTRSQLAQALLVERATVYQWFRGSRPRPKTAERVDHLLSIAKAWRAAGMGSARTAWYLKLRGADRPLGELLASEPLETEALSQLIQPAAQKAEPVKSAPVSGLEGFPADSALEQRRRRWNLFPPTFSSEE
jgi:transcriptional regulator with XRE-family HTH domain